MPDREEEGESYGNRVVVASRTMCRQGHGILHDC